MKVRIFKPSKSTMQSGHGKSDQWIIEADTTSGKKAEPLMGWTSSTDTLGQIRMAFETKEAAIAFAEKKGWQYIVATDKARKVRPRNYGDNFRYVPPKETATK
ncbi:MAG: ETC complex I subunit [Alphaproteobacteria bacterium]|nr:ETC complex I subunit [Alphaproteobacteria bacterium]NCQ87944.1 ETC complex I subunit [Alphaproteobacteria bacterium]NCT05549.1 ETC complex I subunit [Alphaproteobacteria bacterium]